jgi:hypothetical protein
LNLKEKGRGRVIDYESRGQVGPEYIFGPRNSAEVRHSEKHTAQYHNPSGLADQTPFVYLGFSHLFSSACSFEYHLYSDMRGVPHNQFDDGIHT